jgi:hypothetical protein
MTDGEKETILNGAVTELLNAANAISQKHKWPSPEFLPLVLLNTLARALLLIAASEQAVIGDPKPDSIVISAKLKAAMIFLTATAQFDKFFEGNAEKVASSVSLLRATDEAAAKGSVQ